MWRRMDGHTLCGPCYLPVRSCCPAVSSTVHPLVSTSISFLLFWVALRRLPCALLACFRHFGVIRSLRTVKNTVINGACTSQVIHDIGNVFRVAVPMLLYFSMMWFGTFLGCRRVGMRYANAVVHVRASATNTRRVSLPLCRPSARAACHVKQSEPSPDSGMHCLPGGDLRQMHGQRPSFLCLSGPLSTWHFQAHDCSMRRPLPPAPTTLSWRSPSQLGSLVLIPR